MITCKSNEPTEKKQENNFRYYTKEAANSIPLTDILSKLGIVQNPPGYIKSIYKNERTPSFRIYPYSFKDFSTGTSGDCIHFVQDYLNIDFKEAIQWIGDSFHLEKGELMKSTPNISTDNTKQQLELLKFEKEQFEERAAIYENDANIERLEAERLALQDLQYKRIEIQQDVYSFLFRESALTDAAISYLTSNKRKLTRETIERFKLFSLEDQTEGFLRDNFLEEELVISGLFSRSGYYLFNEHTLIIPYLQGGKIFSLKGRYFANGETEPPEGKYKYKALSNFAGNLHAKRFFNIDTLNGYSGELIITEGEFDCMVAEQLGDRAIAVPGVTNFPFDLINLLSPFDITLCFDNDIAGQDAALKTKSILEKELNKQIKLIKLPNGVKDLTEALCQI